jgi:hypothetical protein
MRLARRGKWPRCTAEVCSNTPSLVDVGPAIEHIHGNRSELQYSHTGIVARTSHAVLLEGIVHLNVWFEVGLGWPVNTELAPSIELRCETQEQSAARVGHQLRER